MFRLKLGLSLSLALLFVGCVASKTPVTANGVEGQVLIGPMCPVVQAGTPCPDQPYQATITVLDQNGGRVTEFQSDIQGRFKVGLAPGTYRLRPESPDGMVHTSEQTVTVVAGQFAQVAITYDSGIR
jgi:hypothetical protein